MGWQPDDDEDEVNPGCNHAPIPVHVAIDTLQATSPAEQAAVPVRLLAMAVIERYLKDYQKDQQGAGDGRGRGID